MAPYPPDVQCMLDPFKIAVAQSCNGNSPAVTLDYNPNHTDFGGPVATFRLVGPFGTVTIDKLVSSEHNMIARIITSKNGRPVSNSQISLTVFPTRRPYELGLIAAGHYLGMKSD